MTITSENNGVLSVHRADNQTNQEYLSSAAAAHTSDFGMVAEKHRPQVFRFLLAASRDVDIAEALTQECFLRAHCSWARFRGDANVATWLTRIAMNLLKDNWRNQRLRFWRNVRSNSVEMDDARDWVASRESSPEAQAIARQRVARVWKAVEGMRGRQRTVFVLRFVEEMALGEIANATGLCEGTVKAHLSRALKKVREELAHVG